MYRIKTILISLAAVAACTPATRADDLSELVAAVAASVDTVRIASDVKTARLDSRPRYQPMHAAFDLNPSMLDGIFRSMKRESSRRMRGIDADPMDFYRQEENYVPSLGRPDFFRPVPGVITSRFGWRPSFQRVHHGVDLALHIGDTVRSAISGSVSSIAYDHGGYGHYVVLTHPDGMETLYGHLQYPLVAQGQFIYAGQPIGIGGNSGNSTGPHLHFEARLGGVAVDPMLLFDFYGTTYYRLETADATVATAPKAPAYSHQQKSLKKESTYIVRVGDTHESVARQAGITVMRLCQLNMLDASSPLPVGRMLKLR